MPHTSSGGRSSVSMPLLLCMAADVSRGVDNGLELECVCGAVVEDFIAQSRAMTFDGWLLRNGIHRAV